MKALSFIAGALISAQAIAGPEVDKEFNSMDADQNGKVSAAEHAAGAKRMFEHMDANHDGKVGAAEMTAAHKAITGQATKKSDMSAADKIKAVDSDGDGVLTAEEHAKASASMFAKMDTDKDGFLSKQEMAAGHAAMMKKQ
ncbi:EF-hand domain-containing protein [Pseudoduganella sp. R-43]|uniref:EF-hand domain-containing protein n=1 Tax=unclassified Pseudoduganella TaxID=2637179 RepID=UPI003CF5E086